MKVPKVTQSGKTKALKLPSDIARFVRKDTVDYSKACEYYGKLADSAMKRVKAYVREKDRRCFVLDPEFAVRFHERLQIGIEAREFVFAEKPPMPAADYVAHSLMRACIDFIPSRQTPRFQDVWLQRRPIEEAWIGLGDIDPNEAYRNSYMVYEWTGRKLRIVDANFQHPRVKIFASFSANLSALPKLTIEIEGAPIAEVQRARYERVDSDDRAQLRASSADLLEAIFSEVLISLQLRNRNAHRPRKGEGHEAAILHDREKLSWRQVAQRLCKQGHEHDVECETRVRHAAERWYKNFEKKMLLDVTNSVMSTRQ